MERLTHQKINTKLKSNNYYKTMMNKITCVIRTLACAGSLLDTPVELLTIDMRVEVLIIESDTTVDLLMDRLTDIARIMRTDVSVGGREHKRVLHV